MQIEWPDRSHALRGNAARDALRHIHKRTQSVQLRHSHAERGNDQAAGSQPLTERQILLTPITPANTTAPATIPATAFSNVGTINPAPPAPALTLSIQ